jgi:pyruvate/2-oxoglutarate dehydrogenase complex dihydrolipoamide dehydrogenase (E3) component
MVDVVVVGLGPGGEEVAGRLAQAGLDVVGVDANLVGGTCPYWGCIPSKMMIRAANLLAEARRIDGMAGTATVKPDWAPVAARIRSDATDNWNDRVAIERLERKGGRFIRGHGTLIGPRRVAVGDRVLEASRGVVLGTGSHAVAPPVPGLDKVPYWTNKEAIETTTVPSSLTVLGGGAIGLELAQVFARFGAQVTVVEVAERVLAAEEPEASEILHDVLQREGLDIRVGARITRAEADGERIGLVLDSGERVVSDRLLVATGRAVDLKSLGVSAVGIDDSAKALPVDEYLRAGPGLWGVGDLTGKGAFTHVAMYQAAIVIADILGKPTRPADYHALPRVTFTDPEVGAVGMTEQAARKAGLSVGIGKAQTPKSSRGWIHKAGNEGLIKVVADLDKGVLVGATSMAPPGGEVLGFLALAVQANIPIDDMRHMIYAYPTFHRAIEAALNDLS